MAFTKLKSYITIFRVLPSKWLANLNNKKIIDVSVYAPINVKGGGRGGEGSGNTREFDCDAYPQGGDFDLTSRI